MAALAAPAREEGPSRPVRVTVTYPFQPNKDAGFRHAPARLYRGRAVDRKRKSEMEPAKSLGWSGFRAAKRAPRGSNGSAAGQ